MLWVNIKPIDAEKIEDLNKMKSCSMMWKINPETMFVPCIKN